MPHLTHPRAVRRAISVSNVTTATLRAGRSDAKRTSKGRTSGVCPDDAVVYIARY
jgi:hypothetical protein